MFRALLKSCFEYPKLRVLCYVGLGIRLSEKRALIGVDKGGLTLSKTGTCGSPSWSTGQDL